jgi:nucleotide-binding universal stress UspA family protein
MVEGFKCIMLPIDFSEHCDQAAEYAAWFARIAGARVHLVHVIANPADPIYQPGEVVHWDLVPHAEQKARALLEDVGRRCLPVDCTREYHVFDGDPYPKLMAAAEAIQPDLIVMSSNGRSSIGQRLIGSATEKVVRNAPCPVFVVRHRD